MTMIEHVISEQDISRLLDAARLARENAYAPYSCFKVGAALLGRSGQVYAGCNVENASYGLTICAERVAIGCAVASGEQHFAAIAVAADSDEPVPPCGACLQVLAEFEPDMIIISSNLSGDSFRTTLSSLLPSPFGSAQATS